MTTAEIAAALGVTRQAVDQLLANATRKFRARGRVFDLDGWDGADAWRDLPGFAPGCRQVGCERFRGKR